MNSDFSFSKAIYNRDFKDSSFSYYLPKVGVGRIIGWIYFAKALVLCEMQIASSRIWSRLFHILCRIFSWASQVICCISNTPLWITIDGDTFFWHVLRYAFNWRRYFSEVTITFWLISSWYTIPFGSSSGRILLFHWVLTIFVGYGYREPTFHHRKRFDSEGQHFD